MLIHVKDNTHQSIISDFLIKNSAKYKNNEEVKTFSIIKRNFKEFTSILKFINEGDLVFITTRIPSKEILDYLDKISIKKKINIMFFATEKNDHSYSWLINIFRGPNNERIAPINLLYPFLNSISSEGWNENIEFLQNLLDVGRNHYLEIPSEDVKLFTKLKLQYQNDKLLVNRLLKEYEKGTVLISDIKFDKQV